MNDRRTKSTTREIPLTTQKDNSLGYSLHSMEETVTLSPKDRFVILPGPRGRGWILQVISPNEETNT